jgi:hypothetical protein
VLNGDIADFYAISRWEKAPGKRNFRRELEAVRGLLAWLRQEFPAIPIVFKSGNHEERWRAWLWQHAPEISDEPIMGLDNWLHMPQHGIALVEQASGAARAREGQGHIVAGQPGPRCVHAAASHRP